MKKVIQLINVGRSKVNFTDTRPLGKLADSADSIAEVAHRLVQKHGKLASRDIEIVYDGHANHGSIFAGFHLVGAFKVIEVDDGENLNPSLVAAKA